MRFLTFLFVLLLCTGCDNKNSSPEPVDKGIFKVSTLELSGADSEWEPLSDIVGEASIVALGETVHTSGGYYQAKFRAFKWLVEHRGFRVFAWESPWHEAKLVEDYIQSCEGDLEQIMYDGLFGVWFSQETHDLLKWMCSWNQQNPDDRVFFYGWDAQNPWADANVLRTVLVKYDSMSQLLVSGIETCNGALASDGYDYYHNYYNQYPPTDESHLACINGIDNISNWFVSNQSQLTESEQFDFEVAIVALRSWQNNKYEQSLDNIVASNEARDLANAEIIDIYRLKKYSGLKTVIWAHNFHITYNNDELYGFYDDPNAGIGEAYFRSTGTRLKEVHADDYIAVALFGFDVDINWGNFEDRDLPTNELNIAKMIKEELSYEYAIINFNHTEMIQKNERYQMATFWLEPLNQFDGAIYLEHSWARSLNIAP